MTEAMEQRHVAMQFEDARQQHDAAAMGMWVFLATEVLLFSALFACYAVYRYLYTEAFIEASGRMELLHGSVNTFVLLTSSLFVALAVHAAQAGRQRAMLRCLIVTIALAVVFLLIKAHEYSIEIEHHLLPGRTFEWDGVADARQAQMFFVFYWFMTSIHAVHVLIGIALLSYLAIGARRQWFPLRHYTRVEIVGLYWHFVDIVWIFLFPMLYLISP